MAMTPEELNRMNRLEALVQTLLKAENVQFTQSLNRRLEIAPEASPKTAASATQSVNESGASSYTVMKAPTGFIRVGLYDVPYIT